MLERINVYVLQTTRSDNVLRYLILKQNTTEKVFMVTKKSGKFLFQILRSNKVPYIDRSWSFF